MKWQHWLYPVRGWMHAKKERNILLARLMQQEAQMRVLRNECRELESTALQIRNSNLGRALVNYDRLSAAVIVACERFGLMQHDPKTVLDTEQLCALVHQLAERSRLHERLFGDPHAD